MQVYKKLLQSEKETVWYDVYMFGVIGSYFFEKDN
jgi:hypothetical protein